MNTLLQSGDSPWEGIAPVLDEAVNDLDDADRQAVLLRFFEKRDLRSIGAALGTNEDAAQKRVSRALDKLRVLLAKRGVSLSLAALATFLGGQAVQAAPAGLAAHVSNVVLAGAASGVGFTALLLKLMTPAKVAIALGVAAVAAFVAPSVLRHHASNPGAKVDPALAKAADSRAVPAPAQTANPSELSANSIAAAADANSPSGRLRLTIVAADSGKPAPNVPIDYGWAAEKKLMANREGICEVVYPLNISELMLTTRIDGFADTRLHWRPDRGEKIPSSREATSEFDGSFMLGGCAPGKILLSAEADGYAATTMEVELSENSEPFQIKFQRGKILRLRVVNKNGEPIPRAGVWLDTFGNVPVNLDGP
ncbi:MAG: hypothetical protein DME23_00505 [Verrucomicrobia bacterium]|nr:MAG: hypothetical protein DME23_00505 [Verrucomicrobiota bacterium]